MVRRRLALLAFLYCVIAGSAEAAIAHVQSTTKEKLTAGTSDTLAYPSNVTAEGLLVLGYRIGDPGSDPTVTASDSLNGSWTAGPTLWLTGHGEVGIFYRANSASGANTVTLTSSVSVGSMRWSIHEYSGVATSSPLDQSNTGTAESGQPSGYNITTTNADDLLFSAVGSNSTQTVTAETNYTLRAQVPAAANTRYAAEDRIVSATGTYSGTFTFTTTVSSWVAAFASFKAAAGGGGSPAPKMLLLGVGL